MQDLASVFLVCEPNISPLVKSSRALSLSIYGTVAAAVLCPRLGKSFLEMEIEEGFRWGEMAATGAVVEKCWLQHCLAWHVCQRRAHAAVRAGRVFSIAECFLRDEG